MKRLSKKAVLLLGLLLLSAVVAGCGDETKEAADTDATTVATHDTAAVDATEAGTDSVVVTDKDFEATDWAEETHGNDADPDFEEVFDDAEVKRLDVVVSEENWQLMLD
ncbi:MAG: hypothetical protein WCC01_14790, partial [Acidimicrobiia bacterium]